MSRALQEKIDELFEQTKDLRSFEEIKPHCDRFNEWISTQSYSEKSLGTLFSRYGLYSKFRDLPLEQGRNAELIPKYDGEGRVKGHELKHYVPLLCGLNNQQWQERNQSTRAIDRLENSTEIDPDSYLEVTGKLLASDDPHELAVGIIAVTGRRPHEVLARANFSPVEGKPYHVMFEGQGKKRGEKPIFEIATLYPADYVIKCLAKLRREPGTKALLKEVSKEFKSITRQNVELDKRRNQSLNRVVRAYFGDKGQDNPVLSFRHGEKQDNCKALRAAYAVLATDRDCQGGYGSKILHASRLLGHFTKEVRDDRALAHIATTAGYSDYYCSKPVPFPTIAQKEKTRVIRSNESDLESIRSLQEFWQLPNQQSVVSRLIERHELTVERGKKLQEFQARISQLETRNRQLEKELAEARSHQSSSASMSQPQPQPDTEEKKEMNEQQVKTLIDNALETKLAALEQRLASLMVVGNQNEQPSPLKPQPVASVEPQPATKTKPEPKPEKDFSSVPSSELKGTHTPGSAEEKISRAVQAIMTYNDMQAEKSRKWYLGGRSIQDLTGCNYTPIKKFLETYKTMIDDHNTKHELSTMHNKKHDKPIAEVITW